MKLNLINPTAQIDEEDPYQSEDYQRFLAECAKQCSCSHVICDSVLAGGICENRQEWDDDDCFYNP